ARKPKGRLSPVRLAAWEWLTQPTAPPLAQVLAAAEAANSNPAGMGDAKPDATSISPTAAGPALPADKVHAPSREGEAPLLTGAMADIVAPLLERYPEAFATGHLGSLAGVMEALNRTGGMLRAAAKEVSRLEEVLAEAMKEASGSQPPASRREVDA